MSMHAATQANTRVNAELETIAIQELYEPG